MINCCAHDVYDFSDGSESIAGRRVEELASLVNTALMGFSEVAQLQ